MKLNVWKDKVLSEYPNAQFTLEDGTGKTYGPEGAWTAHTGNDMQNDVVGVFSLPDRLAWFDMIDALQVYDQVYDTADPDE